MIGDQRIGPTLLTVCVHVSGYDVRVVLEQNPEVPADPSLIMVAAAGLANVARDLAASATRTRAEQN